MTPEMIEQLRDVLRANARLPAGVDGLAPADDLYDAGMTSYASVNVMLGVEETFDVEFPDEMLERSVFASMASMAAAVSRLQGEQAA